MQVRVPRLHVRVPLYIMLSSGLRRSFTNSLPSARPNVREFNVCPGLKTWLCSHAPKQGRRRPSEIMQ